MTSWNLRFQNAKIWISQKRQELLGWNNLVSKMLFVRFEKQNGKTYIGHNPFSNSS